MAGPSVRQPPAKFSANGGPRAGPEGGQRGPAGAAACPNVVRDDTSLGSDPANQLTTRRET